MTAQKVILIILDGWGYAPAWGGNAVEMAMTPSMDSLWRKYPHTILKAAEEAVGLPRHEPGNSEVGHLNLGCGQIVRQNLPGITKTIDDGFFFKNQVLLDAVKHAKDNQSNLHLMGLVSDGGIHSHINHLFALLDLIKKQNFDRVFIHMFTDGRDTEPMKALSYLSLLEEKIHQVGLGRIESVSGRYFAMDRDNRWERVGEAYNLMVSGVGPKAESAQKAISESYRQGKYDEFVTPTIIDSSENPFVPVNNNDAIIFFNFRADRAKELTWAFVQKKFSGFGRRKVLKNLYFATFAFHEEYEERLPVQVVFRPDDSLTPLAKVISEHSLKQFHLAETEKYAHVTYFFNGGHEQPFPKESRKLIPSPKVATYDLKPEMSAPAVTDELIFQIHNYDFVVANFANPDMVGHSGNIKATIKACEVVDTCLGRVVKEALKDQFTILVTADHGNAEQMINANTGEPDTEHTINPVPFIVVSEDSRFQNPLRAADSQDLSLSDVAPTILKIMNLEAPKEMSGKSLIQWISNLSAWGGKEGQYRS